MTGAHGIRLEARASRLEARGHTARALESAARARCAIARADAAAAWQYATDVLAYRDFARNARRRARGYAALAEHSCEACGRTVREERVYFGVMGPFCGIGCREDWLAREEARR